MGTFQRRLHKKRSGSSNKDTNEIILDLVNFKTLQSPSHCDNASIISERQKAVNEEHHDRIKSSASSCMARRKIREAQ
jgi:hypothetical protein